jgi:hypothetical protein
MMKNYLLMFVFTLFLGLASYGQGEKFFLDFEGTDPLNNLPTGVTNVNGSATVLVKGTDSYPAQDNAVQADPDAAGEQELFLDFHGYLKMDLDNPSAFSIAYDYRRNDDNDDWWLGFLTFIGNDGTDNRLEQFLIRQWDGQLHYDGNNSANSPVSFNTNYHIVLTSNNGGIKAYVNGSEVLNVPYNSENGKNIHEWTDAALLLSFKGDTYNGTTVTPEPEYDSNARDARVFVDNIALFDRELSATEVTSLYENGNSTLSVQNASLTNVNVYPNPVRDVLNFSTPDVKSVEVYNMLGAKVMAKAVTNSSVNLSQLQSGAYIVNCLGNGGQKLKTIKTVKL